MLLFLFKQQYDIGPVSFIVGHSVMVHWNLQGLLECGAFPIICVYFAGDKLFNLF